MTLEEHWLKLTENTDYYSPLTRGRVAVALRRWELFLREQRGLARPDRVRIQDFKAFHKFLRANGRKVSTVNTELSNITMYYSVLADEDPESRWVGFLAQLKAHKRGKEKSTPSPYKPFPLTLIPEILDASKECREDDHPLVALFTYTGMRASDGFGLEVEGLKFEEHLIEAWVKGDHFVRIPMHRRLAEILRAHLRDRTYQSDQLFKLGKFAHETARSGVSNPVGMEKDRKAARNNRENVRRALARVEEVVRERGIEEHLTSHRFRTSLETYHSQYRHLTNPPLDDKDFRLMLSHGAKTITQHYDQRDTGETANRMAQVDFGNAEFVETILNAGRLGIANEVDNGNIKEELRALINGRTLTADDKLDMMAIIQEA